MTGSALAQVYALGVMAGLLWMIVTFYWLKVLSLLILWLLLGAVCTAAPIYLFFSFLSREEYFAAVAIVFLGIGSTLVWLSPIPFVRAWAARENRMGGGVMKRWNARND